MTLIHWIAIGVGIVALAGLAAAYFLLPGFKQWVNTKGKDAALALVNTYIVDQAQALAEKEYKNIAAKVLSGELKSVEDVKAELHRLGKQLKEQVKDRFGKELPALGEKADDILDDLIRVAADKVSPFPGKETATALLEHSVSDSLIKRGVDWVRENHLKG